MSQFFINRHILAMVRLATMTSFKNSTKPKVLKRRHKAGNRERKHLNPELNEKTTYWPKDTCLDFFRAVRCSPATMRYPEKIAGRLYYFDIPISLGKELQEPVRISDVTPQYFIGFLIKQVVSYGTGNNQEKLQRE